MFSLNHLSRSAIFKRLTQKIYIYKRFFAFLLLPFYFSVAVLGTPILAHTIKVAGDVAVTFHIEPNHNPRVGEPSKSWFVLTLRGGNLISLSECNCQLSVYAVPRAKNVTPLMKPTLKAINAEQYRGIPGADIVFPKVGEYQLELSGTPKANANFKPFKVTYSVTVGGR